METIINRAWDICSPCRRAAEIERIKTILCDNGYPERLICGFLQCKTANRSEDTTFGPEKCLVYLKLPWRGKISQKFEQQVKRSVSQCYNAVAMTVIFTTHKLLPSVQKDVLQTIKLNNVMYEFQCQCDARLVGRTSLRREDRINQHIPLAIRKKSMCKHCICSDLNP